MFDKSIIKQNFSRASSCYDEHSKLQEIVRKKAIELAAIYFPKKSTVLDVGCGTAAFSQEASNLNVNWKVINLDISYGMCEVSSAKNIKNNIVINADAATLPFKDESVDCVFSSLVLQWADNPEIIIKEILRVLKSGGTAVVTTFTQGSLVELKEAFAVLDSEPHISPFVELSQLLLRVAHIGGMVMNVDEKLHVQYFDDVLSIMRSIKHIGASNKLSGRRKGLMTPSQLAKVGAAYKSEKGKYPVSWNVLTMVIGKP
ncbi:MAG: methyltransferase domain-containing protein [Rickettsiales bacterium]